MAQRAKKYIKFEFLPRKAANSRQMNPHLPLSDMWGGRTHTQTMKLRRFRDLAWTEFVPEMCGQTDRQTDRQTTHFAP